MAADNEKLFGVAKYEKTRLGGFVLMSVEVCRTRSAARAHAKAKNARSKRYVYRVIPAAWGPEQ